MHEQQFQANIQILLRHLGFDSDITSKHQALPGLAVDQRFALWFELLDDTRWLMLADLGPMDSAMKVLPAPLCLHDGDWPLLLTSTARQHLACALALPLYGLDRPALLDAFELLLATAEHLLDAGAIGTGIVLPAPIKNLLR
jgi:hypothetical protein